jgi:hypothetical protein
MELMVIIVIVGIMAVLAVPTMTRARNERLMFDYARKIHGIIHRGQTRAVGRGSPHLVYLDAGSAARGRAILFEGSDGVDPLGLAPAPDRDNSCRAHDWSWTYGGWAPGTVDAAFNNEPIEGIDLSAATGVNVSEDITATYAVNGAPATAVAICYARNGQAYVGAGANVGQAVGNMALAGPFNGAIEVNVLRHVGGAPIGQGRKVVVAGGAAPRIRPCNGSVVGCP